jgi:hypothetical protein
MQAGGISFTCPYLFLLVMLPFLICAGNENIAEILQNLIMTNNNYLPQKKDVLTKTYYCNVP